LPSIVSQTGVGKAQSALEIQAIGGAPPVPVDTLVVGACPPADVAPGSRCSESEHAKPITLAIASEREPKKKRDRIASTDTRIGRFAINPINREVVA
jgi:hypothetical protein